MSGLLLDYLDKMLSKLLADASFEEILTPWAQDTMQRGQEDSALCILQATLLYLICKTHDRRDRSTSGGHFIQRYKIVQACRSMHLLGSHDAENGREEPEPELDPDLFIKTWIRNQSKLRMGYMIWVSTSL